MIKYSEVEYHHVYDERTQQERERQHVLVQSLDQRNLNAFKIQLTNKQKIIYGFSKCQRVDLGGGWYCNISDNRNPSRHTFLTIHGAPGDHREWAGLETEMGKTCRWVNLIVPGFDGEDERRGDYDGSVAHLSQLIIKLMKVLHVQKIIFCGHSLGSIFYVYFITHHPQYVEGYINITGIVDCWSTGILVFLQTSFTGHGYNSAEWRAKKLWDDDHHRILMHHKFLEAAEGRSLGPVEFPYLTITEYIAYIKILNTMPNGFSEIFHLNKTLKILRVLIFGQKDPIHEPHKAEATIYNLCWGEDSYLRLPQYQRLFKAAKLPLEQRLREEFGIEVDGEKIQQYLCYNLKDTGHNAHKRRPIEMSKILKVYMACLEVLEKHSHILKSKL